MQASVFVDTLVDMCTSFRLTGRLLKNVTIHSPSMFLLNLSFPGNGYGFLVHNQPLRDYYPDQMTQIAYFSSVSVNCHKPATTSLPVILG